MERVQYGERSVVKLTVDLRTVDLSAYPDLFVIYLGVRVRAFPGINP